MADGTERFKDLVARQIGEQLRQGNLDGLIQAHRAVQASLHVPPSLGEPARADGDVGGEGILTGTAHAVVTPEAKAEGRLVPQEVVDAIRSALPQLANDMQSNSPQVAMLLLTAFTTLMTLLLTAMAAYQFFHPEAPPPPPIEIFNQTYNVVNPPPPPIEIFNQTYNVVNPPPQQGPGSGLVVCKLYGR